MWCGVEVEVESRKLLCGVVTHLAPHKRVTTSIPDSNHVASRCTDLQANIKRQQVRSIHGFVCAGFVPFWYVPELSNCPGTLRSHFCRVFGGRLIEQVSFLL